MTGDQGDDKGSFFICSYLSAIRKATFSLKDSEKPLPGTPKVYSTVGLMNTEPRAPRSVLILPLTHLHNPLEGPVRETTSPAFSLIHQRETKNRAQVLSQIPVNPTPGASAEATLGLFQVSLEHSACFISC